MRNLARLLIRLYPASWRERYGEEFEALLEDSSPHWSAVFDLLKGAMKMRFSLPTFPKLALMLSISGLLTGLAISYMLPRIYVSRAELQLEGIGTGSFRPVEYVLQFENEILSRTSLSNMIQDPRLDLYPEERTKLPLEDVIERMRRDITIRIDTPRGASQDRLAFSVAFAYRDRVKAHDTVQLLITRFMDANLTRQREAQTNRGQMDQFHSLEARIAALEKRVGMPSAPGDRLAGINLDVLDPPSLPVSIARPRRPIFMAIGFMAGVVLAALIAIFRRRPPPIPFPAQTA
jgi:hypothetical protein